MDWLHNLGILDHAAVVHDDDDFYDDSVRLRQEGSSRDRYVPSKAALSIICPSLGRQQSIADKAKVAMQEYLNLFLGNLNIVNSRQVYKFLEVSKLSFRQEYGPKLKEDYVLVKHLQKKNADRQCLPCQWLGCRNWQKVWAVLKPGFLAFLEDPLDTKPLDIIIFDVLPPSINEGEKPCLAQEIKSHKPLHYVFEISCGNQSLKLRTSSSNKVKEWVVAINEAVHRPPEGWSRPHRLAPLRKSDDGSKAQWFIDGQSAFDAIATAIENANSEIFITGWWLCPELYLRRPFHSHEGSRLDALLKAKAKEGVQIYILLYKEVSIALKINSQYSKRRLLDIHENVRVLRYPDHLAARIYYWSHHEKIVVVDYQICFVGGLDLCFGRYDTVEHRVGDFPPQIWAGKDYYNPRESEPNSWEDMMKDELDRQRYPRMPWHDVHCALWGPPCRDVARHFVQRWNYAKKTKAPHQRAIPLLIPHQHKVLPHYLGRGAEVDIPTNEKRKDVHRQDSFSSQSPELDVPLLLPQDSDIADASKSNNTLGKDQIVADYANKGGRGSCFTDSKVDSVAQCTTDMIVDPVVSTEVESDNTFDQMSLLQTQSSVDWWETQERVDQIDFCNEPSQVGPHTSCNCQIIRSVSQWSAGTSQAEESIHRAYCSLIEQAEHFIYIENQFFISGLEGDDIIQNRVMEALYSRILLADREQKCFRVIIVIPLLPGFQVNPVNYSFHLLGMGQSEASFSPLGLITTTQGGMDDNGAATVRALMHWQYRTLCRGENSIFHRLRADLGSKMHDYISFYGLRTYGRLFEGGPLVTSQIAVVIEDKDFLESSMNGKPWMAGKFASSLRLSLWAEHLGLSAGEMNQIEDPVADRTYKNLWMETAKENTKIYHDVFQCTPNDHIHSKNAFRLKMSQLREEIGYTTIDFGVAPRILTSREDGCVKEQCPLEVLNSVQGHVVCFPLEFMRDEDLRPMFHEGEFYTSPEVFH
ncbi:hypothetical protein Cgig2_015173 [Carnegiea gigantea]|uniref:Phospholipase n=1 Tax=Carnegiea gigantea TaxID=171969 RepID=A0A9Q1QPP8_9CARY|nr:hypothetical protein Cgig2_015173 [Carnegiea gigantea]